MNVDAVVVTDEATNHYNCLALTLESSSVGSLRGARILGREAAVLRAATVREPVREPAQGPPPSRSRLHEDCGSAALGITTTRVWPWGSRIPTKAEFDALYRSYGFSPGGSGTIAAFGLNLSSMTHGSVTG